MDHSATKSSRGSRGNMDPVCGVSVLLRHPVAADEAEYVELVRVSRELH